MTGFSYSVQNSKCEITEKRVWFETVKEIEAKTPALLYLNMKCCYKLNGWNVWDSSDYHPDSDLYYHSNC